MRYHRLGRTDLLVSELGIGTVELGLKYGIGEHTHPPSEREAATLLHFALDHGVNVIDTAHTYGNSETIIGNALKSRRTQFVLVSKVQPNGQHPELIHKCVDASLGALQTDWIDVMMLHFSPNQSELDFESVDALARMRDAGKLRYIGASVYGSEAANAAIRAGHFDCLESAYNVLDRRPERGLLSSASENDVGIIARSVLLKGALTERFSQLPAALAVLKNAIVRLAEIAGGAGELPRLAYRYVLSHEPPHAALVGTSSQSELQACLQYAEDGELPPATIAAVQRVNIQDEDYLNPGHWPACA